MNNGSRNASFWANDSIQLQVPVADNETAVDVLPEGGSLVDSNTVESVLLVIECVICPTLTVFGVTGNVMSMIVLLHHSMRNGISVCLAGMALSDSLLLVTTMIRRASCIIDKFDPIASAWFVVRMFNSMFYLNLVFSRITTLLTVLITVNRCVAVAFPLHIKAWSTRGRMTVATLIVYIFCIGVLFPTALYYDIGEAFIPGSNITRPYLVASQLLTENREFLLAYAEIFLVILFRYIPAIILIILNTCILIVLKKSSKLRSKLGTGSGEHTGKADDQGTVTKMLLVISAIFLLALLPGNIVVLVGQLTDGFRYMGRYHNLYMLISGVTFVLEVINSSVNFLVYMGLSSNFSQTYYAVFCRACKSRSNDIRYKSDVRSKMETSVTAISGNGAV